MDREQSTATLAHRWALRGALILLAVQIVFFLPLVVLAGLVAAELGGLRLGLALPVLTVLPVAGSLDGATLLAVPLLEVDLAAGWPVERLYAVPLGQGLLSLVFAVLLALTAEQAVVTNTALSDRRVQIAGMLLLVGLILAMAPGVTGHCAGPESAGGLVRAVGADPSVARALAQLSPVLQMLYSSVALAWLIGGRAGNSAPHRSQTLRTAPTR